MGRLTKAHGLKGAIKIELYTDAPERRFVPGAVFALQVPETSPWHGKTITLKELRWYNQMPVAFFEEATDRTVAETLIKAIMLVDIDPDEPAEEDAWYDHQLVGLKVVRDGEVIGTIEQLDHFPAQDILHVKTADSVVLVPFVKAIVPEVDLKAGTITITPPAGLFEPLPEESSGDGAEVSGAETKNAANEIAAGETEAQTGNASV